MDPEATPQACQRDSAGGRGGGGIAYRNRCKGYMYTAAECEISLMTESK